LGDLTQVFLDLTQIFLDHLYSKIPITPKSSCYTVISDSLTSSNPFTGSSYSGMHYEAHRQPTVPGPSAPRRWHQVWPSSNYRILAAEPQHCPVYCGIGGSPTCDRVTLQASKHQILGCTTCKSRSVHHLPKLLLLPTSCEVRTTSRSPGPVPHATVGLLCQRYHHPLDIVCSIHIVELWKSNTMLPIWRIETLSFTRRFEPQPLFFLPAPNSPPFFQALLILPFTSPA
jgi:hypothetical protein